MAISETMILIAGFTGIFSSTQLENLIGSNTSYNGKPQITSENGWLSTICSETTVNLIPNNAASIAPIDLVRSELIMYGSMEEGWDGPETKLPVSSHIDDAIFFLNHLPAGIPLPTPMLSSSGEVGLYWNRENAFSDIVFEGDGRFSLFVRHKKAPHQERFVEDVLLSNIGPEWLIEQLPPL
jgi:hypothetical protein